VSTSDEDGQGPLTVRFAPEAFTKHVGGVRRVALDLFQALDDEGVQVDVNTRIRNGVGMTTRALGTPSRLAMNTMELAFPFAPSRRMATGVRHAVYYDPFVRCSRWPVVVTVHDMIHEITGTGSGSLSKAKRLATRRADAVVAVSAKSAEDLRNLFELEKKIEVIPNGINNAVLLRAAELPPKSGERRPYILYVGSRSGYKNFNLLETVLADSRELASYQLVPVGGEKPTTDELRRWNKSFGPGRVSHMSNATDVDLMDLYQHASVLVVPARYEGFGLPVLEAMALGCPVACSTGGALPEVASGHARLFSPESVDECGNAIVAALATTTEARSEAASHARSFTWARTAQAYIRVYRSLQDGK
jgi:glycosyltransferase involved in cell wall biosynthesis